MKLFYDMTFELGDLFVTILTFTNYFYVKKVKFKFTVYIFKKI